MPRAARKKSEECMYHIMSRSISEIDLFQCDEDKEYYLSLLKRYKYKYCCRIFAYILMDNHVHIYIDPCGYDISLFMRCLNNAYVSYFNKKYERHGHLYQGRFASSIVDNVTYSLTLSAYIHNNAKDLPGYAGREEQYRYSSYGIYTGYRKNNGEIDSIEFILSHFGRNKKSAQHKYSLFVASMTETGIMKEMSDRIISDYTRNVYVNEKSCIIRSRVPEEVIYKLSEILSESLPEELRKKYSRKANKTRAFVTYVLRILCGYTYKEMCKYIGNMTISGISRLSNQGYKMLKESSKYQVALNSLIQAR